MSELPKILEKFIGIDGRIRNTTKVVLAPKKTFALIEEKDKASRNRNLIQKRSERFPEREASF